MARADAIEVEGVVVEALPNTTYQVELTNGHRLRAFVAGRARRRFSRLSPGQRVRLEMSPYDLSQGRIITTPESV